MYIVIHLCKEINIHSSSGRRLEGLFLDAAFICFPWLDLFWIIYMWKLLTVTISAFSETWLPLVNYKPDGGFCNLLHLPLMLGQGNLVWTLTLQLVRFINHPIFFFLKSKLLHSLGWSLSLTILPRLPKCLDDHYVPPCPAKSTNLETSLWYSHRQIC